MTDTPGAYQVHPSTAPDTPPPTIGELRTQAHALVEQLARRPQAIRLLGAAVVSLGSIAQYKATRRQRE